MNKIDLIVDRYYYEIYKKEGIFNFRWYFLVIFYVANVLFLVGIFIVGFHDFSLGDNSGIDFVIEQTPVIGSVYRLLLPLLPEIAFKGLIIIILFVIFYVIIVLLHKCIYGRLGTRRYRAQIEKEWEEVITKRRKATIALIKEYNVSVSFVYDRIKDRLERLPKSPNIFSDTVVIIPGN